MQDGTIRFGFIVGAKEKFPRVVVEFHGSQFHIEYAATTIVGALDNARELRG